MGNSTITDGSAQNEVPAYGGVARRERRTQGAGDRDPVSVIRGHNLQDVAIIDWLSFTLPAKDGDRLSDLASWLLDLVGLSAEPLERGAMGYTHGWRLSGGGLLLYNPARGDMGCHCSLSAGSLALLSDWCPRSLIAAVLTEGGWVTRIDIAIDTDAVDIATVDNAVRSGCLVSRAKKRRYYGDYDADNYTIYIGERSAQRFVRIYNKAAEQQVEGVWTRCEVEYKGKQAQTAAVYILQGEDLRSLVLSAVDFRDSSEDANISRCSRLSWWAAWVGNVRRLSFAAASPVAETVERVFEWVRRQVAPSLAFLDFYFGKNPTWLYALCDSNAHRISAQRRLLLDSA